MSIRYQTLPDYQPNEFVGFLNPVQQSNYELDELQNALDSSVIMNKYEQNSFFNVIYNA